MSKNILITGASRGIGFQTAITLCKKGHNVLALARSGQQLEELKEHCRNENHIPETFVFDIVNGDYNKLTEFVTGRFGKLDGIINNAGLLINKPFEELTGDDFDKIFQVNVKSIFSITRNLMQLMNRGSHIVNISSMGGFQGSAKFPGLSLYSAAKGAVAILSEAMAVELKEQGISVNALALGAVQTEMLAQAFPGYKAPLQPEEIAGFIADFVLTGHRFFNGKILPVSSSNP